MVYTEGEVYTQMPMISLKVPDEMLKRIDEQAKAEGLNRTSLLLKPWYAALLGSDLDLACPRCGKPLTRWNKLFNRCMPCQRNYDVH